MLGLLVLQSMSSFVLDSYQELLRNHLVVTLFLTMLVGAGGNAGNQSAIKVIRGLVYFCSLAIALLISGERHRAPSVAATPKSVHSHVSFTCGVSADVEGFEKKCRAILRSCLLCVQATGRIKATRSAIRQTMAQQCFVGLLLASGLTGRARLCSPCSTHSS